MKPVTQTVEKITGYLADDGTWFHTEEECRKYEDSARMAASKAFRAVANKEVCGEDFFDLFLIMFDSSLYSVHIKNADVLQCVNTYLKLRGSNEFVDPSYIGHDIVLSLWDGDCAANLGTRTRMEDVFRKFLDRLFGVADTEQK